MKRCWLLGFGAISVLLVIDPAPGFGGHGHTRGSHPAKEGHEAPKHSGGKPAPKPSSKPQGKQPAKPQGKPKGNDSHKQEPGKSRSLPHESNLNRPTSAGSSSNAHEQSTKNDKTKHHDSRHEHHGWHHDRWWHGHHHIWSEEGYWVDAGTGLPVVAGDVGVPGDGIDGTAASPTPGNASAGRPQIHFNVEAEERESYDAAAQAAGVSRAEWIRSRLNAAVSKELK
jgi:hypothetical protein